MKIQVNIDGETKEVEASALNLPDGHEIINRQNPPNGLFTQKALDQIVQDRLSKEPDKIKNELRKNDDFVRELFQERGVSLNDEGKPVGLKPEFDVEEWKEKNIPKLTQPIKDELEQERKSKQTYRDKLIEQSILSATKGAWQEQYTKHLDDGRVKPIVVNQYKELFDIDDNGTVALRDQDGNFAVDTDGKRVTPDKYLTNDEKFGDFMIDNRQRSSNFQNGSTNGKRIFTEQEIADMTDPEYEKNREAIHEAQSDGRIR